MTIPLPPPLPLPAGAAPRTPPRPPVPTGGEYPPVAFYFSVNLDTRMRDADCSFREVSGIAAEMDLESVVEGGENRFVHQLPKAVKHPRLVLKRGIAPLSSRLLKWCKAVLEGDLSQPLGTRQMWVSLLDAQGAPLRSWSFENVFPVKWEVEPFQSSKNEVALEKVELSYLLSKREV